MPLVTLNGFRGRRQHREASQKEAVQLSHYADSSVRRVVSTLLPIPALKPDSSFFRKIRAICSDLALHDHALAEHPAVHFMDDSALPHMKSAVALVKKGEILDLEIETIDLMKTTALSIKQPSLF